MKNFTQQRKSPQLEEKKMYPYGFGYGMGMMPGMYGGYGSLGHMGGLYGHMGGMYGHSIGHSLGHYYGHRGLYGGYGGMYGHGYGGWCWKDWPF